MAEIGRPEYTDPQYEVWLEEMRPFLQQGKSLSRSIELSGLNSKRATLYNKYKLHDWFLDKVDAYRQEFGEMINDTMYSLVVKIKDKVKRHEDLSDQEVKLLTFNAEKHRSAQPFFVNRFETAKGKPIEEVIGDLDKSASIDDVTDHLEDEHNIPAATSFEVLAPNPSIQDQGQEGASPNVPSEPDPSQA